MLLVSHCHLCSCLSHAIQGRTKLGGKNIEIEAAMDSLGDLLLGERGIISNGSNFLGQEW